LRCERAEERSGEEGDDQAHERRNEAHDDGHGFRPLHSAEIASVIEQGRDGFMHGLRLHGPERRQERRQFPRLELQTHERRLAGTNAMTSFDKASWIFTSAVETQ